ncbi:NAD-dependent epimerase/dehydratase family protein [Winogradskya humida]
MATLLAARGDQVIVASRSGHHTSIRGVEHRGLDASDADALTRAADGAATIFNTANPGAYPTWEARWPPLAAALLIAAERTGAGYAMTGNLYPYGPVDGPIHEGLPEVARDHLGRLRSRIWADARAAHEAGRVRAFEVRGSDFVGSGQGTGGGEGHVSRVLPAALRGRTVRMLGRTDQPHTFTDVLDMARTLIAAADDPGAYGRVWHAPSNPPRTQAQIMAELMDAAGRPRVTVKTLHPTVVRALGAVSPVLREVAGIDYIMTRPYVLDASAAKARFSLHPTDWDDVLRRTLKAAGA